MSDPASDDVSRPSSTVLSKYPHAVPAIPSAAGAAALPDAVPALPGDGDPAAGEGAPADSKPAGAGTAGRGAALPVSPAAPRLAGTADACAPAPCSAPAALAAAPGGAGDSLESNIVPAGAAGPAAKLMPDVSSAAASALRALLCGASPANVAESSGLASSCQAAMTSSLCPMLTYMAYIARPLVSLGLEVNTLYVSVPLGQESLNGMTDPMTDKTPWPSGGLTV